MKSERRQFAPRGPLALEPSAFGMFFEPPDPPSTRFADGVAIVPVRGPLETHAGGYCDSYESIAARVVDALAKSPKAVVLAIDSPGGLVAGCFGAARAIRSACDAAGVPLHAYVDGMACSAAYALACVAEKITVSDAALVGSIGVIDGLVDVTEQDRSFGVRVQMIGSGARKLDGNPHEPITDDAISASRARVNELAGVFFEHVSASRGLSVEAIRALEASIFVGRSAVEKGLADVVGTASEAIAIASSGRVEIEGTMADKKEFEDAIASLRKAAEGEGDEAEQAKKMLAALEDKDEPEAEGDEEEPKAEEHKEPDGDEEPKAAAKASAKTESVDEKIEKAVLLSQRSDLDPKLAAELKCSPLATVRAVLDAMPRKKSAPAATAVVAPTRGSTQGDGTASAQTQSAASAMDAAMGVTKYERRVVREGNIIKLGAIVPKENGVNRV